MPANLISRRVVPALLAPMLTAFQAPPSPEAADRRVLPRIVRDCPGSQGSEEIVVCGRREDRSPYRLPELEDGFDWRGSVESVSRERNALLEGGESGIGSCSTTGPGGMTGCFAQGVRQRIEQRAGSRRSGGGLEF